MEPKGFTSRVLNIPYNKKDPHGALQMPVYLSNAFEFEQSDDIAAAFAGTRPAHVYSRSSNPTVEYFEGHIKALTGAVSVTATASGMAAISASLLTLLSAGDTILTTHYLFGNTISLFESTLAPFGVKVKFADLTSEQGLEAAYDQSVRVLFFETIANPQLEVVDVRMLSAFAARHNILLIADTTMTPPYVFSAGAHGVDIEVLSTTKFISGGATSVGGLIMDHGRFDWAKNPRIAPLAEKHGNLAFQVKLRKEVYRNTGACMSPFVAFLQTIGLETLALRMDRAVANAGALAAWLQGQPGVRAVDYPGLPSSRFHEIAMRQFNYKPGSVLTFDLASPQECFRAMDRLQLARRATNFNDNKTLVIHPHSTIYVEFPPEKRLELGIRDTMIRVSVGIEDIEDLQADFAQALAG
jgi:O-acetylhomoserine (thiol)-lyase